MLIFLELDAGLGEFGFVSGLNGAAVGHENRVAFGLGQQGRTHAAFGGS